MDNTAIVSVQEQKQMQLLNNGLITADRFINVSVKSLALDN